MKSFLLLIKKALSKVLSWVSLSFLKEKRNEIVIPTNNYKLIVPKDLSWAYSGGDYYEQNVIYFLDRIVKSYKDPIMLDIGANCGYYSIKYANLCQQIFSFEPVSDTYSILNKNIKRNSIKNIVALKYGLSDHDGEILINLYNSSGNNSIFERKIPEGHSLKKTGSELIKVKNLDYLIKCGKVTIPHIIKIDVEGAELQILMGAEKTITQHRPTILTEYSENTSADAGYQKEMLLNILNLNNYNIYGIPEEEMDFSLIQQINLDKYCVANLIFIPAELDSYLV